MGWNRWRRRPSIRRGAFYLDIDEEGKEGGREGCDHFERLVDVSNVLRRLQGTTKNEAGERGEGGEGGDRRSRKMKECEDRQAWSYPTMKRMLIDYHIVVRGEMRSECGEKNEKKRQSEKQEQP